MITEKVLTPNIDLGCLGNILRAWRSSCRCGRFLSRPLSGCSSSSRGSSWSRCCSLSRCCSSSRRSTCRSPTCRGCWSSSSCCRLSRGSCWLWSRPFCCHRFICLYVGWILKLLILHHLSVIMKSLHYGRKHIV